jgi:hypothetical protein
LLLIKGVDNDQKIVGIEFAQQLRLDVPVVDQREKLGFLGVVKGSNHPCQVGRMRFFHNPPQTAGRVTPKQTPDHVVKYFGRWFFHNNAPRVANPE